MITLIIDVVMMGIWIFLILRSARVSRVRMQMIMTIAQCPDFEWRLRAFDGVSYHTMVLKFWKPVTPEAFYAFRTFLDPTIRGPVLSPIQRRRV